MVKLETHHRTEHPDLPWRFLSPKEKAFRVIAILMVSRIGPAVLYGLLCWAFGLEP